MAVVLIEQRNGIREAAAGITANRQQPPDGEAERKRLGEESIWLATQRSWKRYGQC
jgi:hypothetical protein